MDRQICTEGHSLASRGSPSDVKTVTRGTDVSIHTLLSCKILFLARLNAAKFDFHTIYLLEKCYNGGVRHFELQCFNVIVTCVLSDLATKLHDVLYNQC